MKVEGEFTDFLNFIIQENKFDLSIKEKFLFLSYENYLSDIKPENKFIIYEDWWVRKPEIVKSKIKSTLGISKRLFARKCTVKKITKPVADLFLEENHIYGTTKSKIKYGLFYENKLYAVAAFAGQRQFRDGSRSGELLRYCNKNSCTIIGGLDKLLQAYSKEYQPDTLMTYIDADWGKGKAFLKLGFEQTEIKPASLFYVNKKTGLRIAAKYFDDFEKQKEYVKIRNSGSIKMLRTL